MSQRVHFGARPIAYEPIRDEAVSALANAETVVISQQLRPGLVAKQLEAAFYAAAGSEGFIEFRYYLNGVYANIMNLNRVRTQFGVIGQRQPTPGDPPIMPGAFLEVRAANSHATSAFAVEADLLWGYFERYEDAL